jgi:uncharacterized RDD family membrane protein YckC
MSETHWHYVDTQQQKIGPVSAAAVKEAYQRGDLRRDGLVWNAELPQWQSLASHAAELGIDLSRAVRPVLNGREIIYANFFHRWAALMLDQWVLSLTAIALIGIIATAVYVSQGISFEKNPEAAAIFMASTVFAYLLTYISLSGFYHVHFETSSRGGSWGKQYLGLEVRTEQGEALDKRTALLRWFSAALSHLSQSIGFLIAAFTEKRQALHDFVAHTLVLERETRGGALPINRNKRAIIILILGIAVMPIVLTACMMVPMFHFIQKEQQAELQRHQKMAALVVPIQQALQKRMSVDQHCLSQDDDEIKPLLLPLKPLASEVYVGLTEDEQACEIYLVWDSYKSLSYRYTGEGDWTCEASEKAADFGQNCQLSDY